MFRYLILIASVISILPAQSDSSLSPRERHLADQLKSPCCWSESLLVHRSPEAQRLRGELTAKVRQGQTDEQIIAFFVTNYGSRILRDPPGKNQLYLNILPILATILGLAVVIRWIYHARAPQPSTS